MVDSDDGRTPGVRPFDGVRSGDSYRSVRIYSILVETANINACSAYWSQRTVGL